MTKELRSRIDVFRVNDTGAVVQVLPCGKEIKLNTRRTLTGDNMAYLIDDLNQTKVGRKMARCLMTYSSHHEPEDLLLADISELGLSDPIFREDHQRELGWALFRRILSVRYYLLYVEGNVNMRLLDAEED